MRHKDKTMWFLLGAAAAALLGLVFWSGLNPKTTGAGNQAVVSCKTDTGCNSDPNSPSGTGSACPAPDPDTKYACKCAVTKTTDSGTETLNQFTLPNMTPATCDKVGGPNNGSTSGGK